MLDSYVWPTEKIVDYRVNVTGITEEQMTNAPSFSDIQSQISTLIEGKIVVGYDLKHILQILLLIHPKKMQRNISTYTSFVPVSDDQKISSLKRLAEIHLNIPKNQMKLPISTAEYAQISMLLYRQYRKEWDSTYIKPIKAQPVAVRKQESLLFSSDEE